MNYRKDLHKGKIQRGNFQATIQFLIDWKHLLQGKRILEIGCGAGHLTDYLLKNGFDAFGIDISKDLINYAQTTYLHKKYILMDAQQIALPDNSFDIVLSFDVLEHLPRAEKHIDEVKRILKRDSYYIFQTPNKLFNIPFEIIKNKSFTKHRQYHCSLKTYWSLKKLFRSDFTVQIIKCDMNTDFLKNKLTKTFGTAGLIMSQIPFERFPAFLQTNFFGLAQLK
ncbi:MAG: class I SAM-dependent methyltransferase [Desulfobacteraceae bacterium]|nr:MAG: class I SAM-dependent methyltransferase [Desulfobacteraceae bacterium]